MLPRIDRVVAQAHSRELRSDRHSPWVVLHAVIAFGDDLKVLDVEADETINAIDYLLTRATHDGKRIFRDDDGVPALPTWRSPHGPDRPLLVQDHVDQYLMVLSDTGVKLDRKISAEGGRVFTVADMLSAVCCNSARQPCEWLPRRQK